MVSDNAFAVVWKSPVVFRRMGKGIEGRVERALGDGAQIFSVLLAKYQSNSQPRPIGKHRSLEEVEPQSYDCACDTAHRAIWLGEVLTYPKVDDPSK